MKPYNFYAPLKSVKPTIVEKYNKLVNLNTNYATRMNRLSNRIFGEVVRPTNVSSLKVVKMFSAIPTYKRPDIVAYYPRHIETQLLMKNLRLYGLYRDEHEDFKDEMERLRELRGKGKKSKWWAKVQERAAQKQQTAKED